MKSVKDIMTREVAYCLPDTPLTEVTQMMVDHDCGCIPIVDNNTSRKPVGVVTERDICCRAIARGQNPLQMTAGQVMSSPVTTVTPTTSLEECCRIMEDNQVRRVLVVDDEGGCCGIVAQADIALKGGQRRTAEVVQQVSQPTSVFSQMAVN